MNTDFIGFSFDGIHSSDLNILRVSNGDRYNEALFPEIEDLTVDIPGGNGTYYYGTRYVKRNFEISIAYDSVTETQFRNIRRLFGQQAICPLIFDERPYKVYMAKVESPIELEYICFDEEEYDWIPHSKEDGYIDKSIDHKHWTGSVRRIYKGEGTINFVCYFPFAKQQYKTIEEYEGKYGNIDEWVASSGIVSNSHFQEPAEGDDATKPYMGLDHYYPLEQSGDKYTSRIYTYNPGDIDAPYYLFIPYNDSSAITAESGNLIYILTDGYEEMRIKPFTADTTDLKVENGIIIDTRGELIQGVYYDYITKTWKLTGNVYNKYIESGKFGKIRHGNKFEFGHQGIYMNCGPFSEEDKEKGKVPAIFYNYLYY